MKCANNKKYKFYPEWIPFSLVTLSKS